MPLYELLCLARPVLPRAELAAMISAVGGLVYDKGGVITNVVSYGKQPLAYRIKGVQGKFEEVRGGGGEGPQAAAAAAAAAWGGRHRRRLAFPGLIQARVMAN